jgi:hypothetical protein
MFAIAPTAVKKNASLTPGLSVWGNAFQTSEKIACKSLLGGTGDAASRSMLLLIGIIMQSDIYESVRYPLNGWRVLAGMTALGLVLASSGCANDKIRSNTEQVHSTTLVPAVRLTAKDLQVAGIAFITPSSATGQEEDRVALALAFAETLRISRPDLHCVTLPDTLSAINRAGLTTEYKRMFEDSRLTGIFDRESLQKVARATGSRYLAQIKLGGFRQDSKSRWGALGFRLLETKSAAIRLFLQIWDSQDGSVVWEGSQELTLAYESMAEEAVSLQQAVEASAREFVTRLPAVALVGTEPTDQKRDATEGNGPALKSTLSRSSD